MSPNASTPRVPLCERLVHETEPFGKEAQYQIGVYAISGHYLSPVTWRQAIASIWHGYWNTSAGKVTVKGLGPAASKAVRHVSRTLGAQGVSPFHTTDEYLDELLMPWLVPVSPAKEAQA